MNLSNVGRRCRYELAGECQLLSKACETPCIAQKEDAVDRIGILVRTVMKQDEIIKEQSGIIDELFVLLCQLVNIEETAGLDALMESMQAVAKKKEV